MPTCRAVEHVDLGLLVLRVGVGVTMFLHGYNNVFGGGTAGTGRWFASMGMSPAGSHARLAAAPSWEGASCSPSVCSHRSRRPASSP